MYTMISLMKYPGLKLKWLTVRTGHAGITLKYVEFLRPYNLRNYNMPANSWKPFYHQYLNQSWSLTEYTGYQSSLIYMITFPEMCWCEYIFFQPKEQFMMALRRNPQPPEKNSCSQLYADLSQHTMQTCKFLLLVTKALCNHNNVYRWGYPTKLTSTRDGNTLVITSLDEGLMCSALGIFYLSKPQRAPLSLPNWTPRVTGKWSHTKRKTKHTTWTLQS